MNKVVAVIKIRSESNTNLYDVFSELVTTCEKIVINDENNLLSKKDAQMLFELFDVDIYKSEFYDLSMYSPDWILTLYDDERPDKSFRFMKDSYCYNKYVKIWEADFLPLWDSEEKYRSDKLWGQQKYPFLFKWIPEIDYQYKNGCLVPHNQPGPQEYCSGPMLSYRYLDRDERIDIYKNYLKEKDNLNYITQLHYESLLDKNPVLKSW